MGKRLDQALGGAPAKKAKAAAKAPATPKNEPPKPPPLEPQPQTAGREKVTSFLGILHGKIRGKDVEQGAAAKKLLEEWKAMGREGKAALLQAYGNIDKKGNPGWVKNLVASWSKIVTEQSSKDVVFKTGFMTGAQILATAGLTLGDFGTTPEALHHVREMVRRNSAQWGHEYQEEADENPLFCKFFFKEGLPMEERYSVAQAESVSLSSTGAHVARDMMSTPAPAALGPLGGVKEEKKGPWEALQELGKQLRRKLREGSSLLGDGEYLGARLKALAAKDPVYVSKSEQYQAGLLQFGDFLKTATKSVVEWELLEASSSEERVKNLLCAAEATLSTYDFHGAALKESMRRNQKLLE